jgi:Delta24(24(1))-sterol reductase
VNGPIHLHPAYTAFCYILLLVAYYIWDTSNCQKSVFKAQRAGTWDPERWRAPPQLPWAILDHPKTLGGRLLVDGWWKYARKVC